jgi:hypothetical protein
MTDKQEFHTSNPKHLRVIAALLTRPCPREQIDRTAGVSNGPDVVFRLRGRGLAIPCERVKRQDLDGEWTHPGIYHLTAADRKIINGFLSRRAKEKARCERA